MPEATDAARDFTFTFRALTDGVAAPGVFTYMTDLRVHGPSGRAVMFISRHNGDLIGRPVGLFGASLSAPQTLAIASAMDAVKWAELPQPTGGDVSSAMLSIDYSHGPQIIQRSFNSRNVEFIRAISPIMTQVDDLGSALLAKPLRALDIAVLRTEQGFKLTLRNIGTGPIVLADPRPTDNTTDPGRGTIRLAANPEGTDFAMLIWKSIPLEALGGAPTFVLLPPGATHEVATVGWTASAPGDYLAQATWIDYSGPKIDPTTVMPLVPDPADANVDARPYVVRGAAFSSNIQFSVEKQKR